MRKVLVLGKIHERAIKHLRDAGPFEVVERADNPADLKQAAADIDAIIVRTTPINQAVLDAAPRLRIVARHGVGYDAVDVAALTAAGIPLALTGDVNSTAVAEHTLALMLDVAKLLTAHDRAVRNGNFAVRDRFAATELDGRTILIIGLGRIGRKVARLCRAFGMTVLASDPLLDRDTAEELGVECVDDRASAFARADFVSIHAPKIPGAEPVVGARELAAMPAHGVLINVARGGMVDEAALVAALDAGRLAGAGLDVFEKEPLAADSPLARHEKIVVSPHSAAFTGESIERMGMASAGNIVAFARGTLDPALVVNPQVISDPGWMAA